MKNYSGLFAALILGFGLMISGVSDVEAKRFGGAGSFGGRSSYSSPFKRSANTAPRRSASQQKAYQQNQAARQSMSRRGGLMGMLGGLALGGLLGSLFFGGAFEGLNFMDILIFGGIAYLLYKMFAAKAGAGQQTTYQRSSYNDNNSQYSFGSDQQESTGFDTDVMFKKNAQAQQGFDQDADDADFDQNQVPQGFNEEEFLKGAVAAYKDLQHAWDNKDLAEIRGLTTDSVFAEIQSQIKSMEYENHTDILKIDAELLNVRELGSELEAVVLFDSILREEEDSQAEQIREVWHFIKPKNSIQPKWYLDGIQQLAQ